jgi:hypothetical protein
MTNSTYTNTDLAKSALLAGLIAAFIWMVITVLEGSYSDNAIVGGAVGLLVVVALITAVTSSVVRSKKSRV